MLVDAGKNEAEIMEKMKASYSASGWNEENFIQFTEHDFERYYPARFQEQVTEVLRGADRKQRQERKKALLDEVKQWIADYPDDAKTEFASSAKEVIEILKAIKKATD